MADEQPVASRTDPVVDRVNELTTTLLDTAGIILLSVAAFWAGERMVSLGLGFALAAVTLMLLSGLAQRRSRPRAEKKAAPVRPAGPPGPSDPGNLHVKGR